MSAIQQIDKDTLNRLDLPKTTESGQGLDTLYLEKSISLVYVANALETIPRDRDVLATVAIGAAGQRFTCPINAQRIIFGGRFNFSTTATVGSRALTLDWRTKANSQVMGFLSRTVTASLVEQYQISPSSASTATVTFQISYPMILQPEDFILFDDASNIHNTDTVSWVIDYTEVPR